MERNVVKNLDKSNEIELTKEGHQELKDKLKYLLEIQRPQIQIELAEARAQGDLSENADYDAAKNKQAEIEAEISKIEDILSRAKVISTKKNSNEVRIGSIVTYRKNNKDLKVMVVPEAEFNPLAEIIKVGTNAPLAIAMISAKIGDKVTVNTSNPYMIEIIKID